MLDSNTQKFLKLSSVVRISDFSLPESQVTFNYETPDTIWNCMKQKRPGDQASSPTFMFPDINAGPDLVFLLQKQMIGSEERTTRELHPGSTIHNLSFATTPLSPGKIKIVPPKLINFTNTEFDQIDRNA
jgi:hypothetical protein